MVNGACDVVQAKRKAELFGCKLRDRLQVAAGVLSNADAATGGRVWEVCVRAVVLAASMREAGRSNSSCQQPGASGNAAQGGGK